MRRSFCRTSAPVCVALAFVGVAGDGNLAGQTCALTASPFKVGAGRHETRAQSQNALQLPNPNEVAPKNEIVPPPPPTRSSFMATWPNVSGAKGYLLDVSPSSSFNSFVDGYHDLDVGDAIGRVVTGLSRGTTYYYRVRAYGVTGPTSYSEIMSATTQAATGLIIHATFDSSITGNPNSAAIQATINQAISIYESLFSDPITIEIRFRYSTTEPNGDPIPAGRIAQSNYVYYTIPWNTYIDALRADARTGNDDIATASLPVSALSTNILPASAAGRAVGLDTPPAMIADETVGSGGPYDGIVTLNSASRYQFTRPPIGSNYDAQRAFEHEMDEVIGLGSHLNISGSDLRPQDLFSWSSAGQRNTSSSGTRYFSINGGVTNIVNFNQDLLGDFGDWLSEDCPQSHPYVQNAFGCTGQSSDVTATSPEAINLDVIGYDLLGNSPPTPTPSPTSTPIDPPIVATNPATNVASFSATLNVTVNPNGLTTAVHFDYGITTNYGSSTATQNYQGSTTQNVTANLSGLTTGATYHFRIVASNAAGTSYGADMSFTTLVARAVVSDFNGDSHPDLVIQNTTTHETVVAYLSNTVVIDAGFGATLPAGWRLAGAADFDGDGHTDYVLFNPGTGQTVIAYLSGLTVIGAAYGPSVPLGWELVTARDFNSDAYPDYVLYKASTGENVIAYMNNTVVIGAAYGPTLPVGWNLIDVADFNSDGHPDYALFNSGTGQTVIGYLSGPTVIAAAFAPTIPLTCPLVATADLGC